MNVLRRNSQGSEVAELQQRLKAVGFNPGKIDGQFGLATEAAVMAFQRSSGLLPDGIVGPRTAAALGLDVETAVPVLTAVTVRVVSQMFPSTPIGNINVNLPVVLGALVAPELTGKKMVLMALATIRAETESFRPISEMPSRFNTSPSGPPFDLYDRRQDLGNQGPPDGEKYRGRGFIQLTGRHNYQEHGRAIGLKDELLDNPDLANDPGIAAQLLASFLKAKELPIKQALLEGDLRTARRLVNGGSHGLDRFTDAYTIGDRLLPDELA
ncbi:MAG: peptidoglycan-binding protein [Candidatus Rokuibacteriota bacterium]|nr:MAG: peptidoglycan-binding protein [Candidatus Rokubacteria bacterium]